MEAGGHTKLDCRDEIHLNVGGQWYNVNKYMVARYRESKLYQAVSRYGSDTNVLFVEGDGRMFQHVLNFVTTGKLVLPPHFNEHELLIHEVRETYGIKSLVDKLENVRRNEHGEHLGPIGLKTGLTTCSRSFDMYPQMNSGRPFLTDIAVLQKYPLLKQKTTVVWLTENGFAFVQSEDDHFRHILNSCHHGVCLIPQDHSEACKFKKEIERYGITDKANRYFYKDGNTQSNRKKPASHTDDMVEECCPPIYVMAIEILQRLSSTHNLGRLEISPTKDGKGLVIHGSGNMFVQASQCLGVDKLLLLEELSDFHDMYEAVKVSDIPALVTAVEDFQRSPPFLPPVEQSQKSHCPPFATEEIDLLSGHNSGGTVNPSSFGPEVVSVYVGNQTYATSRYTLTEAAKQSRIPDSVEGALHLRGDGDMFRHILNYFRTGRLMLPPDFAEHELLICEANCLGVSCIASLLDQPSVVLKKAEGKEVHVKAAAVVKKQKRTKTKRRLCSCPECYSTASEKAPNKECFANLSSQATVGSETVPNKQEIASGIDAHDTQGRVVINDVASSRNNPEHSVFIKLAKTGASKPASTQGPLLSVTSKDNCSGQHKLTVYQGRASVCQVGPDGRLQIELILSKPDNGQKPKCLQQRSSSPDENGIAKQSGNPKTLMELRESCLSSASQRLMQMSKTVLEIQTLTKTDIPFARRQFPTDSVINPTNCSKPISSLPDPAHSESKVAVNTDHSYSHPPSKVNKSVTNKTSSLKGAMKPPKSKPKLVTISDSTVESHCQKSTSRNYNSQGQEECKRAEDFGYIAVIKHPHVHGHHTDKGFPYKPFSTSRLYIGAQNHLIENDVTVTVLSLLNHTRQLCEDRIQRSHSEVNKPTKGEASKLTKSEEDKLDVEEYVTHKQTVAYSSKETTAKGESRSCAVGETKSAMSHHTGEHLVSASNMAKEDNCSEQKGCDEVAKLTKSPDASIESTPKGSIHLRNLTKLCSQVSWLHSVPQQPDVTAQGTITERYKEKTVLAVSEMYAKKENTDPNTEHTGQSSRDVTHADSSKDQALASGDISVRDPGSPPEDPRRQSSTDLPLTSTPEEEGILQQKSILLPLSDKDVVYARMCHRFLLGVIEDSKRLGDMPALTAEVARLVLRLWNANLSPSAFAERLSQLAPFKSHTCEHLTLWIKRSLSPARWYALSMLELVEKQPAACSITTSRIADIL
ncbi:KCTD19 [Branchiostoma lanceolatum]|uniref:KCTD19 protein n=1 Tax=Branchiostoma lanceolatum TaxID=7740 RepID=A0A8K0A9Q4_BRALA|nr:KCTD19 [Branchiostoma lanceolatum]